MEKQLMESQDEIEIDLGEIVHLLISRLFVIILSGMIVGLVTIAATMFLITPKYDSTTKMYVLSKQDNSTVTSSDMQLSTLLTKDYAELIKSRTVTESVIAQLNLDTTHEKLLSQIDVSTPTDTRIISITVRDEDPYKASEIASAIRDASAKHIQAVMDIEAVNVVDEANIPVKKSSPSLAKNGVIGGLLGCFIAIAVILITYFANDTIETPEDVERYLQLSVLGNIPMDSKIVKAKKMYKRKKKRR